jgi:hypothetical protein
VQAIQKSNQDQMNDGVLFSLAGDSGHAQPLSAQVLTPSGFVRMGDLRADDEVITLDGSVTKVTNVFPQGRKPIYRVVLSDGSQTRTTADHLWSVRPYGGQEFQVLSLAELMPGIAQGICYEVPEIPKLPPGVEAAGGR